MMIIEPTPLLSSSLSVGSSQTSRIHIHIPHRLSTQLVSFHMSLSPFHLWPSSAYPGPPFVLLPAAYTLVILVRLVLSRTPLFPLYPRFLSSR